MPVITLPDGSQRSFDRPVTVAEVAASIVQHALAQLAYYKAPGYVAFVEALPLTASQKIQRGELRVMAQQLPGQPHCIDTRGMKKRGAS